MDINKTNITKILTTDTNTDFTSSPVNLTFGLNDQIENEAVPISYGFIGDFESLELNGERYYNK